MAAQQLYLLIECLVVRGNHASFGGGHVLGWVEGITNHVVKAAHIPSTVPGSVRLGSIPDDLEAVFIRQGCNSIHIARVAEQVNRGNSPGAGCDTLLCILDVKGTGVWVHVTENRTGPDHRHHAGRGDEGKRWHQHLVARFQERGIGNVQCCGARTDRDRIAGPHTGRKPVLKLSANGPFPELAGAQDGDHLGNLVFIESDLDDGDKARADWLAAVSGESPGSSWHVARCVQ